MYGNHFYNQPQRFQQIEPMYPTFNNPTMPITQQPNSQGGLLGKSVDSIDVVKAMDIPLDGSTSYFPLTDGTAIVTKKLQADGTSKTVVYKPVDSGKNDGPIYATIEDLENLIEDMNDFKDLKSEFKTFKKDLKELKEKLKED